MRTKLLSLALTLLALIGCENNETKIDSDLKTTTSALAFTKCTTVNKSTATSLPSIRLIAKQNNFLLIKALNTEFCCATDSVSAIDSINNNKITIEIVDLGRHSWCYCPHDADFLIGPLKNGDYYLKFIESQHAYLRDTFDIAFEYTQELDSIYFPIIEYNSLAINPLEYLETKLGGCNNSEESEPSDSEPGNDTIIFNTANDSLLIHIGTKQPCCIDFNPESFINGDTLILKINTLDNQFCDCMCYYTFDFFFTSYTGQVFNYRFMVDDLKQFDGKYKNP